MILLDTTVLIYAADGRSKHHRWALQTIAEGVASEGAAVNAVTVAETCVGDSQPETVADRIRNWGVAIVDLPAAASLACAVAYSAYRKQRQLQSDKEAPVVPLPDFFIGAHAQIMGWTLATADTDRFKTYFPTVPLKTP
jgi:predicted nucleic acid-binding protein